MTKLKWSEFFNNNKRYAIRVDNKEQLRELLIKMDEKGCSCANYELSDIESNNPRYNKDQFPMVVDNHGGVRSIALIDLKWFEGTILDYHRITFIDDEKEEYKTQIQALNCIVKSMRKANKAEEMKTLAEAFDIISKARNE